MKHGPVTKLDKRIKTTSKKKVDDGVMSEDSDAIVIFFFFFQFMVNLEQSVSEFGMQIV